MEEAAATAPATATATTTARTPRHLTIRTALSQEESNRGSRLRRTSSYLSHVLLKGGRHEKPYDGEYKAALINGEVGNGIRTWYSNFTTIDWLHDFCKEDYRLRTLRARPGIWGAVANNWDRLQGWIAVAIIGTITAVMAFLIIRLETFLFHLKDGYCQSGWWRSPKACPCSLEAGKSLHMQNTSGALADMQSWDSNVKSGAICSGWRSWTELVDANSTLVTKKVVAYSFYILLAVCAVYFRSAGWALILMIHVQLLFAIFASYITIKLSASDTVQSTKDSLQGDRPGPEGNKSASQPFSPKFIHKDPSYGTLGPTSRRSRSPRRAHSSNSSMDASCSLLADTLPRLERISTNASRLSRSAGLNVYGETVTPGAPKKIMYFAAGSGIPEIKTVLSGFVIRGYLGGWTLLSKALGLCFSVGSGLNLGKEGPFVHLASCIGNITSRFFAKFDKNEAKRRELLSAACAAGVAVSFGAPIGGILFSLEEVSYFFPPKVMFRSFVCAMLAATTLKALDPFATGKIVLFEVTYDKDWHFVELLGFVILGVMGGLYGAFFNKANIAWTKTVRIGTTLKSHPILEVSLVTLATSMISFWSPLTKMGGTELVYEMFSECTKDEDVAGLCIKQPTQVSGLVMHIAIALLTRALLTIITFGIKLPAGIFIPTLAVGACFGRILGLVVEYIFATIPTSKIFTFCQAAGPLPAPFGQACVLPGVWAMVGAAAALAGVTRTTVSLVVIMFELTGTLTYVTPVMVAVLFSKTTADYFEGRSIYDLVIELNQLPYLDAKEEYILEGTIADVVDLEAPSISLDCENTLETLNAKLLEFQGVITGFPILSNDDGVRLQGYLGYDELEEVINAFASFDAGEAARPPPTPCSFRDHPTQIRILEAGQDSPLASATNVLDLGHLVDRAPMTVSSQAPLQQLHQLFIRLGVRYLAVQDERGCYVGTIEKNRWLGYLKWLKEEQHSKGLA